jgi:hypothetical protein
MEMREMGQGTTDVISLCSQTEISAPGSASPFRRHRETVSSSTAFHHQVSLGWRFSQCNTTVPMHLARELAACGEATIAFRHERPGLRCLRSKLVLGPKGHDRHQGRACLECWVGFRAEDEFSFVLSGAVERWNVVSRPCG